MHTAQLPKTIDPLKAAKRNLVLNAQVSVEGLPRIQALCKPAEVNSPQVITINFHFELDAQNLICIKGMVKGTLQVRCERCLGWFDLPIQSEFILSPIEQALEVPPEPYEPVMMNDQMVDLWGVIEEELLLNIPYSPMHDKSVCKMSATDLNINDQAPLPEETVPPVVETDLSGNEKVHPFAVLKKLKNKEDH